jgi:hypothetical protein
MAELTRFPEVRVTVIVLCNLGSFGLADELARGRTIDRGILHDQVECASGCKDAAGRSYTDQFRSN